MISLLGSLDEEEEVLQWLITQKTEDRIELITRVMLEAMVEDTQYLAVYFCKFHKPRSPPLHVPFDYSTPAQNQQPSTAKRAAMLMFLFITFITFHKKTLPTQTTPRLHNFATN